MLLLCRYGNLNAVAVAYERSKIVDDISNVDLLQQLLEVMESCRLKFDAWYYIDISWPELRHLTSGPEPEMRIIEHWQSKGFAEDKEFRLIQDDVEGPSSANVLCTTLQDVPLDKVYVRYLLRIAHIEDDDPTSTL